MEDALVVELLGIVYPPKRLDSRMQRFQLQKWCQKHRHTIEEVLGRVYGGGEQAESSASPVLPKVVDSGVRSSEGPEMVQGSGSPTPKPSLRGDNGEK